MRQFRHRRFKTLFMAGMLLCGGITPIMAQATVSDQTTSVSAPVASSAAPAQTAAERAQGWIANIPSQAQAGWGRVQNSDMVHNMKREIYPLRTKIRRNIRKSVANATGANSVTWAHRNMSTPALFLVLALFFVFGLLMMTSPISRTGNHH